MREASKARPAKRRTPVTESAEVKPRMTPHDYEEWLREMASRLVECVLKGRPRWLNHGLLHLKEP